MTMPSDNGCRVVYRSYHKLAAVIDLHLLIESFNALDHEKKHKENNRDRTDEKLRGTKKELEMTQEELDSAMDYYDKLKTQCVDTGLSYEERKKMREEELVSLQEALKILSGEDI